MRPDPRVGAATCTGHFAGSTTLRAHLRPAFAADLFGRGVAVDVKRCAGPPLPGVGANCPGAAARGRLALVYMVLDGRLHRPGKSIAMWAFARRRSVADDARAKDPEAKDCSLEPARQPPQGHKGCQELDPTPLEALGHGWPAWFGRARFGCSGGGALLRAAEPHDSCDFGVVASTLARPHPSHLYSNSWWGGTRMRTSSENSPAPAAPAVHTRCPGAKEVVRLRAA